jgi:hypothetical protein
MRRVLRMIGLVFVMIGLIGLVSSGTSALAQFMDLPGEACFTAPPGGAQRVPQCTAPTGYLFAWQSGMTDQNHTEATYEYCSGPVNDQVWCEVDWTNTTCLTWDVYSMAGCTGWVCEDSVETNDCHTTGWYPVP